MSNKYDVLRFNSRTRFLWNRMRYCIFFVSKGNPIKANNMAISVGDEFDSY